MEPTTNNNPGATAPSENQEDLSQTRYFQPVVQNQPEQAQQASQAPQAEPVQSPYNPYPPQPPYGYNPPPAQPGVYGNGYNPQAQPYNGATPVGGPAPQQGPGSQTQFPLTMYGDKSRAVWGLVLVAAGVLFLANTLFSFSGIGSLFLLLLGGIFMYAYFNTRPGYRIGYLIPGAILLGLGVGTSLEDLDMFHFWGGNAVPLFLGLGFCFIWFMERKHWWALIPGGILVLVGISSVFMIGSLWPLLLIGVGAYLLLDQTRRRHRS